MKSIKALLLSITVAAFVAGCSTDDDNQHSSNGMNNGMNSGGSSGMNSSSGSGMNNGMNSGGSNSSSANHQGPRTPTDGVQNNP